MGVTYVIVVNASPHRDPAVLENSSSAQLRLVEDRRVESASSRARRSNLATFLLRATLHRRNTGIFSVLVIGNGQHCFPSTQLDPIAQI